MRYDTRVKAAVLLLVLSVLASVLPSLSRMHVTAGVRRSPVERYGLRLAPLRDALPRRGMVGYVDQDTSNWSLHRTQYFLAPVLIDRSVNHDLVIGNFEQGQVNAEWLARRGLALRQDFGDGVMLFTRISK